MDPRFSFLAISAYLPVSKTWAPSNRGSTYQIDGYLGRGDSHANTIDDASGNEHTIILASYLNSRSQQPEQAADEDGVSAADSVG